MMVEHRNENLGFDAAGKLIVAGPLGENCGLWTDSTMTFNPADYAIISEKAFGMAWSLFDHEINREGDTFRTLAPL